MEEQEVGHLSFVSPRLLHVEEEAGLPQSRASLRSPPTLQRGDRVDLTSASYGSLTFLLVYSFTHLHGIEESSSLGASRVSGVSVTCKANQSPSGRPLQCRFEGLVWLCFYCMS